MLWFFKNSETAFATPLKSHFVRIGIYSASVHLTGTEVSALLFVVPATTIGLPWPSPSRPRSLFATKSAQVPKQCVIQQKISLGLHLIICISPLFQTLHGSSAAKILVPYGAWVICWPAICISISKVDVSFA